MREFEVLMDYWEVKMIVKLFVFLKTEIKIVNCSALVG
jgi:hypothetical protein